MRKLLFQSIATARLLYISLAAISMAAQEPADPAAYRLSTDKIFAIGGIGFAGITSEGEKNYRAILREPRVEALKSFNGLYETGNPQAKTYALLGINKLDPVKFKVLYASLPEAKTPVRVERGCIISIRDLRDLARDMDLGKFPYDK